MCTLATIHGRGQRSILWSGSLPVTLLWVPCIYSGHQARAVSTFCCWATKPHGLFFWDRLLPSCSDWPWTLGSPICWDPRSTVSGQVILSHMSLFLSTATEKYYSFPLDSLSNKFKEQKLTLVGGYDTHKACKADLCYALGCWLTDMRLTYCLESCCLQARPEAVIHWVTMRPLSSLFMEVRAGAARLTTATFQRVN